MDVTKSSEVTLIYLNEVVLKTDVSRLKAFTFSWLSPFYSRTVFFVCWFTGLMFHTLADSKQEIVEVDILCCLRGGTSRLIQQMKPLNILFIWFPQLDTGRPYI